MFRFSLTIYSLHYLWSGGICILTYFSSLILTLATGKGLILSYNVCPRSLGQFSKYTHYQRLFIVIDNRYSLYKKGQDFLDIRYIYTRYFSLRRYFTKEKTLSNTKMSFIQSENRCVCTWSFN